MGIIATIKQVLFGEPNPEEHDRNAMKWWNGPREKSRAYAEKNGFFWLPCPLCGKMFGGHEWLRANTWETSPFDANGGMRGKGVCPGCTERVKYLNKRGISQIQSTQNEAEERKLSAGDNLPSVAKGDCDLGYERIFMYRAYGWACMRCGQKQYSDPSAIWENPDNRIVPDCYEPPTELKCQKCGAVFHEPLDWSGNGS